jgi:hypothetical protein
VENAWARVTCTYHNYTLLHYFLHATPYQVINMWNRIDSELDLFHSELVIRRLANKNDENRTRLPVYKEDLEGLRVGNWVGNTIIDVFAWKTIKRPDSAGVTNIYKPLRIMDGSFMYYMYEKYKKYNYNGCLRMVTKKTVDENGHVWSFLSHQKIFVPVHKHANHWFLFVVCPANRQITSFDSLYDQGPWHVMMFDNIVKFIHDNNKSKEIPKDKWALHMHLVVVDKKLNLDDCGVCTCLAIYCLVHGLDYRTMPTFLSYNKARIFVYYTVMRYQFYQDESYNSSLDEVLGVSTIVDDDVPPIDYIDDANRHERDQPTLTGTNPPQLPQVTAADLQFPNEEGEISLTDDDDNDPNDKDYTDDTPTNLASTLNQEHTITAVLGLTDMANAMATKEEQILEEEDNDGAMNEQVN